MRFMIMHKTNAQWESGATPGPDLVARVGRMLGELKSAGVLRSGEGLRASALGGRLRFSGGQRTVTPGPFGGENALPARYAIVRAASLDEPVEIVTRFAHVVGDGEIDVRPVTEPWDLGFAPKPEGLTTLRYMAVHNADADSERGTPPTPEASAAMEQLVGELSRAGVLLAAEGFEPSARGRRIRAAPWPGATKGKPIVRDGPFTETKELIAGFVIVEVPSLDEATRWALRYLEAVDADEVDVRGIVEYG